MSRNPKEVRTIASTSSESVPILVNSSTRSKKKSWFFNGVSIALFVVILGLCLLPTLFYYTAENIRPANGSLASNLSVNVNFDQPLPPNALICGAPLTKGNYSCKLQCRWTPWKNEEVLEINATTFTACILAITCFIVVLLTWFKIPQLWRFPHVIIVIMLAQSTVIVILTSLGILLGDNVFCSTKFWDFGAKFEIKSTTFCKFEGVVLHYLEGSISLWFAAYNVVVAKGLVFDKIHIHQGHRLPFIISALLCWLLPVIPVIVVFNSNDGYNVPFYSNFCFPSSIELVYYTAVLPENILFTIGVSFLYIVIWKLLKERQAQGLMASQEHERLRQNKMDNVVARLTLLMVFYAATFYLTYGSMAYNLNKAKAFQEAVMAYFACLVFQPDCSQDYRKYTSHIPLILNYVAAALFPVSTVLFLAANEKARRLWRIPYHHFCNFVSKDPAASRNTTETKLVNENSADRQLFSQT